MSKQSPLPTPNKPKAGNPGKARKPEPLQKKDKPDHDLDAKARGVKLSPADPPPGNRGFVSGLRRVATVQAKARVGRRDDPLEDEADRVAAQVVDAPTAPRATKRSGFSVLPQAGPSIAPIRGKTAGISAKSAVADGGEVDSRTSSLIDSSRGGGRAMSAGQRDFFESRMGHDFGNVRFHTGSEAQRATSNINARAFTTGSDVFFGKGQFQPDSNDGKRLIAHELTHVVQQGAAGKNGSTGRVQTSLIQRRGGGRRRSGFSLASITGMTIAKKVDGFANRLGFWKDIKLVLGFNPLTGRGVPRTPMQVVRLILRSLGKFGRVLLARLRRVRAIEKVFNWFTGSLRRYNLNIQRVVRLAKTAWDKLRFFSTFETKLKTLRTVFRPLVRDMVRFGRAAVTKVKQFVFQGFMKLVGGNKGPVARLIRRARPVIWRIWNNPVGFAKNVFRGIKLGVQGFLKRIKTHLKKGFMEWLFGSVGRAGIVFPEKLTFKGIASILLQVTGITYANFRERAVRKFGQRAIAAAEKGLEFFQLFKEKGPLGVYEQIKEQTGVIVTQATSAIKRILILEVIKAGILWIISLLNPGSAIVRVLKALVDVTFFVIRRAKQLIAFGNALLNSVVAIAKGNVSLIARRVESAFGRAIPVAIGLLANLVGIKAAPKIQSATQALQKPANSAIDAILNKMRGLIGGKRGGKGKGKGKDKGAPVVAGLDLSKLRTNFKMSGEPHSLSVRKRAGKLRVIMASKDPAPLSVKLDRAIVQLGKLKSQFPNHDSIKRNLERLKKFAVAYETDVESKFKVRNKKARASTLKRRRKEIKPLIEKLRRLALIVAKFAFKQGLRSLRFQDLELIVAKIPAGKPAPSRGMILEHDRALRSIAARGAKRFIIVRNSNKAGHDLMRSQMDRIKQRVGIIKAKPEELKMKTLKIDSLQEIQQIAQGTPRKEKLSKKDVKTENLGKVAFPPPPFSGTLKFFDFVLAQRQPTKLFDELSAAGLGKAAEKRRGLHRGRKRIEKALGKEETGKSQSRLDAEQRVAERLRDSEAQEKRLEKRDALTNQELYRRVKLYLLRNYGYVVQKADQDFIIKQRRLELVQTPSGKILIPREIVADAITGDYDLHGLYRPRKGNKGRAKMIKATARVRRAYNTILKQQSGIPQDVIMHGAQDEWPLKRVLGIDPNSTAYLPNGLTKGFRTRQEVSAFYMFHLGIDLFGEYKNR